MKLRMQRYERDLFGMSAQYGRSLHSPSRFAHYNNITKILGSFLTLCLPPAYPSGDTKPRLYNILIMGSISAIALARTLLMVFGFIIFPSQFTTSLHFLPS